MRSKFQYNTSLDKEIIEAIGKENKETKVSKSGIVNAILRNHYFPVAMSKKEVFKLAKEILTEMRKEMKKETY